MSDKQPIRILLVDENAPLVRNMHPKLMGTLSDVEVVTATRGDELNKKLESKTFDLILFGKLPGDIDRQATVIGAQIKNSAVRGMDVNFDDGVDVIADRIQTALDGLSEGIVRG